MAKEKYSQYNKFNTNRQVVDPVIEEQPTDTPVEEIVATEPVYSVSLEDHPSLTIPEPVIIQPQPESKPQMAQEQAPQVSESFSKKEAPVQAQPKQSAAPAKFQAVYRVEMELNNYLEVMGLGKSITPELGGTWQYSLYHTVKGILAAKDQVTFNAEWGTLLHFFDDNKGNVFNDKFIFRFPEYWPGSANGFTSFRRLIYLAMQTSNIQTRKTQVKDISLERATEGLQEDQKNKLINFYTA